jgi:hypothetical protein
MSSVAELRRSCGGADASSLFSVADISPSYVLSYAYSVNMPKLHAMSF